MWGDISIARRMSVIMAAVVAGMVLVGIVSLVNGRNELVRDREQQVQRLVESAVGVLAHFQKEATAGRMTEADAQDAALAVLRDVRYGNKDYFFVYQYDGLCRMQAADPKLEGQNRIGVTDVQGVPYVRDIVTAASQGGGFVRYSFPRLGADRPSPKLGFAAGFEPWKWAVVTAIYVDDIDTSFRNRVWQFGGIVLAIIVVVGGVVVVIGRGITGPLTAITGAMTRLAGGDLSAEIPASARKDEIGAMARAVQVFKDHGREIESLRLEQQRADERAEAERKRTMAVLADSFEKEVMDVVGDVTLSAQKMDAASSSMSSEAEHGNELAASVAAASVQASANVQTVASATEELSASIKEISRQVDEAARIATVAADQAASSDAMVSSLAQSADKINDVVQLIDDIAGQTNLLALNATIEAARAGEAGKGFAVVAGEVKDLANQTGRATNEIGAQIGAVQTDTKRAVEAIAKIKSVIDQLKQISAGIASAVEQQGAATREIIRNIEEAARGTDRVSQDISGVRQSTGNTKLTAGSVKDAANALAKDAERLNSSVAAFLSSIRQG